MIELARYNGSKIVLIILLLVGLLLGGILGDILGKLGVPYIHESQEVRWHPAADFGLVKWDIDFVFSINVASVLGLILAFWIYRKL